MLQAIQQHGYYADQPESALRLNATQHWQQAPDLARQAPGQGRPYGEIREGSNTLRLRGLPYSAGVDEITEFFSGEAAHPIRQGGSSDHS